MASDSSVVALPIVALALEDRALFKRLSESLHELEVRVESLGPDASIWDRLEDLPFDVLVVERHLLSKDAIKLMRNRDESATGPGVVVIGDSTIEHSDSARAQLVAAGVSRVLFPDEDPELLASTLETLGWAEAAGGQEGPEIGGQDAQPNLADFLSRSPYMRKFLDTVYKVSDAESSLLITGETGVGKERLARAIHAESQRGEEPFVAVNCGALPENLLESELFGHEKGAFTGADTGRVGRFEEAHKGTIFLDEIGEMPAHLQVKLLTVLQRHEIRRVGGEEPIQLDVRVMAATNRDVADEVASGKFREDLYYRLNVISLEIPSLRERVEDLPDLVGFLIAHFREVSPSCEVIGIREDALAALMAHDWPGNVRELINVIERAMLLADGKRITLEALPASILGGREAELLSAPHDEPDPTQAPSRPSAEPAQTLGRIPADWHSLSIKDMRERAIEWAERQYLVQLLKEHAGHMANTAEHAGISPRALYERLKRYGIDKNRFKP